MPGKKVPVELCSYTGEWNTEDSYKAESLSSRSSSPKSLTESWTSSPISISEASESPEGSVISDSETEADRIANDLDNMKITEIQAEEMMKEGADMRHVLKAAYQLKPKCLGKMKFKKGTKLNGRAVLSLLNFDYKEKEEDMEQKQRMSRAWAEYEHRQMKGKGVRPPPGFSNLDQTIAKKYHEKVEDLEFLVSYANGTNTLNLATEPIVVHDLTVSCVVDSCRVFLQQMKNPTFEGLRHLEEELFSTYTMLQPKPLLRPIAQGSVLAVFSDAKWYRCQVVSYNSKEDTCDIKFVDHGGYTTVPASDLRQLKSDFLRLPFQAIEVYLAHVNPSVEEIQIDLTSEILFHGNISIKLLGQADDGIPMIQAYYYDGDYINIFTQEIIDACRLSTDLTVTESISSEEENQVYPALPCNTPTESETDASYPTESETDSPKESAETEVSYEATTEATPEATTFVTYPYYCQETGFTHYSPPVVATPESALPVPEYTTLPSIAYCYEDANGMQQVYYVAGPYILPTETITHIPSEDSSSSSEESSAISMESSSDNIHTDSSNTSSPSPKEHNEEELEDLFEKPSEEWTQEDYARYYGH